MSFVCVAVAAVLLFVYLTVGPEPASGPQAGPPTTRRFTELFNFQNPPDAKRSNSDSTPAGNADNGVISGAEQLVPIEWEGPLFEVLLLDRSQGMQIRNDRLLDLATNAARGVPTVQRECLRHLAFGLSDNDGVRFVDIATNPVLPVELRAEFLKETLVVRPPALGEWLGRQLHTHSEPEIGQLARRYLLNVGQ